MIKLKNTPEQVELVKAIGSRDPAVSGPATEAFAAAIGPVIQEVLLHAGTSSLIYSDYEFNEDDNQSIPLDLFRNEGVDYVRVWASSPIAGNLATSEIAGAEEMKFTTYTLESAVSFLKKYARKSNFNVLSRAVERMLNETLFKQELQGWAVILRALGEASTDVNGTATKHTVAAGTAGTFKIDDLSRLITRTKRIEHAYTQGTPTSVYSKGITDLWVSPEVKEDIRAFAYNPMNTTSVPNTDESANLALPDSIREKIYNSAGASSLFDINMTDLNEFGTGQIYNTLFAAYATAGIAPASANFAAASNEILVGADLSRQSALRPVARDGNNGSTAVVLADDQFRVRDDRVGFYIRLQEGRLILDSRAFAGIVL